MLIFHSTAVVRIILSDEGGVWEGRWSALEQYIKFEKHNVAGAYQEHSCLPPHFQSVNKAQPESERGWKR